MEAYTSRTAAAATLRSRAALMDARASTFWTLALDCDRWGLVGDGRRARRASRNATIHALALAAEAAAIEARS